MIGDKVGLIDTAGHEVFPPQFGRIVPLSADRFLVAQPPFRVASDKFGLMSEPFALDRIEPLPSRSGTGTWGIMDREGRWIVEPRFDHIARFSRDDRQRFWAKRGTKWQLMRADGEALTDALFDQVCPLQDGRARVVVAGKWGLIDADGRIVIQPMYDSIAPFRDGLAVVRRDHREGVVDRDGRVVISALFDRVEPVKDGRFRVRGHLDLWFDRSGDITGVDECADGRRVAHHVGGHQIAVPPSRPINDTLFPYIHFTCDAPSLVRTGERGWNYVDAGGKMLLDHDFDVAYPFGRGIAVGFIGRRMQIIDERGTVLIETPEFPKRLSLDHDGGGAKLIVDRGTEEDEMLVPLDPAKVVDLARDPAQLSLPVERKACGEGVAGSRHGGKWGFADAHGALFISPRFDAVGCFRRGLAWAAMPERRQWCQIDKRGAVLPGHACVCEQPLMWIYPEPPPDGTDCYARGLRMIGELADSDSASIGSVAPDQ
jgi:WG containing repeat